MVLDLEKHLTDIGNEVCFSGFQVAAVDSIAQKMFQKLGYVAKILRK